MIIDFHTHAFPDALAERAIAALVKNIEGLYKPVHNGTIGGLLACMDNFGIDMSVLQPVVTKQSQTKSANEWAAEINDKYRGRIISFGGIFPHTDDYKRDIDFVCGLGLKGLKFHAEYQDFILDDEKMLRIYDYALSRNLILMHHAGADAAFSPPYKSSPKQFAGIVRELKGGVIIAAHLGGHEQWDDVFEYLAGENIYLDTSMGFDYFSQEKFLKILTKHGADKIIFGSDSPWSSANKEIDAIKKLPISESGRELIFYGNSKKILNK